MANILRLNAGIIKREAIKNGFNYDGSNIFTFAEWKDKGYFPVRGQKAFIKIHLWTKGENRRKTLVGLFTSEQVEKLTRRELVVV